MNYFAEGACALAFALSLGVGGWALSPRRKTKVPLLSSGACFALGAALFGTLSTFLEFTPVTSRAVIGLITGVVMVSLCAARVLRSGGPRCRAITLPKPRTPLLFAGACALGAVIHLSYAYIAPLNYDVLSYHLPLASRFEDVFKGIESIFYGEMPMLVPALTRFVMPEGSMGVGPAMMLAMAVLAGANSTARIAAWLGARSAGRWAAAALYLWHPIVLNAGASHLSDPWTALFAAAAAESLLAATSRHSRQNPWALFGLFAGAAVATKLSAVGLVAIPLGIVLAVGGMRGLGIRRTSQGLAAGLFVSVLIMTPWVTRNLIVHEKLSPTGWSAPQQEFVVNAHGPQSPLDASYWRTLRDRIGVPGYTITDALQPQILYPGEVGPRAASISFLLIAALATLTSRRMRGAWGLLAAAGLAMGALALLRDNPSRFYLVAIPWLAACAARYVFDATPRRPLRMLLTLLLGASLAGTMLAELRLLPHRGWATNTATYNAQIDTLGAEYIAVLRESQEFAAGGRTLMLFEGRNHLLASRANLSTVWDPPKWHPLLRAAAGAPNPVAAFSDALRGEGYDRVFVNEFEYSRLLMFYDKKSGTNPKIGQEGFVTANTERSRRQLMQYPAHKIAQMSDDESKVLEEFLARCRTKATKRALAGAVSEIWLAPIP
jgi:hypothetical protein